MKDQTMTAALETKLESPPANDAEEIQRLRKTKDSLHQTAQQRKVRIDELEAQVATLTAQLQTANKTVHDITVGLPLKALAEEISVSPSLFAREFSSRFGLINKDGVLFITKAGDNTPLLDGETSISFTANAVNKLLESDAMSIEDREMFRVISIGSRNFRVPDNLGVGPNYVDSSDEGGSQSMPEVSRRSERRQHSRAACFTTLLR
jgi:hypothetical protein